jgi:hypothetical protein
MLVVEQDDGVDLPGVDTLKVHPHKLFQPAGPRDRVRDTVLPTEVEVVQPVGAVFAAGGDLIEFILHRGGEVVVNQPAEVLLKQSGHGEGHP